MDSASKIGFAVAATLASAGGAWAQVPAFSGATGPGAVATGGRGGDVYHVTNLNPDKNGALPGSLQYGINNAPGAGRTIVFDVGGTIYLAGQTANDTLRYGKSNITIAGQTAPGPGITIAGTGTKWTGGNVILRNVSIRPNKAPVTYDAFSLQLKNSIVDHVSATWFTDEGISITDAGETTTVQYSNISEGLNYGGHSFGSIITTERDGTKYSFNHNMYAHNASRMPRVGAEIGQTGAVLDFTNNVLYNWSSTKVGYGGENQPASTNFINNYYVNGRNSATTNLFVGDDTPENSGVTKVYQAGNKLDSNRNGTIDGVGVSGRTYFRGGLTLYNQAFDVPNVGTPDSADVALQRTVDYGGANWQNRNAIDDRIMRSVLNGTGQGITDLTTGVQAAEWAAVLAQRPDANGNAPFARAADFDTDRDGMPDIWEVAHGLNPLVATGADGNNGTALRDGYTNLEAYINELGAWPAASTVVFGNANGTGRYAEIGNWQGGSVKPSRFDAVQVNAGTATIDVDGQHARMVSVAATLAVTGGWIDVAETLSVGSASTGRVVQTGGVVRAGNAVVIGGSGQPAAYDLSGGTLAVGTLTRSGSNAAFNFTGGVLHADTVGFSLVNEGGTLAPGSDAELQAIAAASMPNVAGQVSAIRSIVGSTRVVGDLTLLAGTLQIDLASLASFDTVAVDGTLTLGGGLAIALVDGYEPTAGSQWRIGTAGGIGGAFAAVTPGFSTQIVGNELFLVAGIVPEPAAMTALLAMAGVVARRRR